MALTPVEDSRIPAEEQRALCAAIFYRLIALNKYDHTTSPPLRSSIILLKPTCPTLKSVIGDYGLHTVIIPNPFKIIKILQHPRDCKIVLNHLSRVQVSREKIETYTVDGNHVTILENDKIATAINGEPLEDAAAFKATIMEDGKILTAITNPEPEKSLDKQR